MSEIQRGVVPPGTYAGGARSPVTYVLLCPSCGGYAPITDPDYSGFLSGQCQGCGVTCRELHRFPARIDSAGGCRCRGQHPPVTGDLRDAGTAEGGPMKLSPRLIAIGITLLAVTGGVCFGAAIRNAVHHGHAWPLLAAAAAVTWTGTALALWLPYRAEKREAARSLASMRGTPDAAKGILR